MNKDELDLLFHEVDIFDELDMHFCESFEPPEGETNVEVTLFLACTVHLLDQPFYSHKPGLVLNSGGAQSWSRPH